MRDFGRSQVLPNPLSDLHRTSLVSRRQDQSELFTAITGSYIVGPPGCLCQDAGELAQDVIARLVPCRVIERFEVVEIKQQQ